jgi:acyl carrier protein
MIDARLSAILLQYIDEPNGGFAEDTPIPEIASLSILELGMKIEDAYDIEIPDEDILAEGRFKMVTVGDLAAYIARRIGAPHA